MAEQQLGDLELGIVVIGSGSFLTHKHDPTIIRIIEPWALGHRQTWNYEALERYGERVILRRRWNVDDFRAGRVARCSVCSAGTQISEIQKMSMFNADGGSFSLTFKSSTTAALDYDINAATLQVDLEDLFDVGPGNIKVTGGPINLKPMYLEFFGNLGGRNQPLMTADYSGLTDSNGMSPLMSIEQIRKGTDQQQRIASAYKQSGDSYCDSCFGTNFEGGFEPIIYITYALISDQQQETTRSVSGVLQNENPFGQFPPYPPLEEFDLLIRVLEWDTDGLTPLTEENRFQLSEMKPTTLRTGPATPTESMLIGQVCNINIVPKDNTLQNVRVIA